MKLPNILILFLFIFNGTIAYSQNVSTEDLFKSYLVSEDEAVAKVIINSNDQLYSLYCKASLTEDLTQKIELYTKFIQLNSKIGLAKAYLSRGIAYNLSEAYKLAIDDHSKSIELDGTDPYSYYFRGQAYQSLKEYDKATQDYNQALKLSPEFALVYLLRGITFYEQQKFELALEDMNKTIRLEAENDQAYLMRGIVLYEMGTYKKAIADWKKAKKINKENTEYVDSLIGKANEKTK